MKMTLSKILSLKSSIKKLINDFGYSDNIRIYFENSEDKTDANLHFIVEEAPSDKIMSYKNSTFLQAKLIQLLGCQVNITVKQEIDDLYKYDYQIKSVPFNEEGVKEYLKEDSLELYEYKEPEDEQEMLQLSFELANKYFEEEFTQKMDRKRKLSFLFKEDTITNQRKEPKLQINESNHLIALMIPIPDNFNCNKDIMTNPELAKELASSYFEKIKSLMPEKQAAK